MYKNNCMFIVLQTKAIGDSQAMQQSSSCGDQNRSQVFRDTLIAHHWLVQIQATCITH